MSIIGLADQPRSGAPALVRAHARTSAGSQLRVEDYGNTSNSTCIRTPPMLICLIQCPSVPGVQAPTVAVKTPSALV